MKKIYIVIGLCIVILAGGALAYNHGIFSAIVHSPTPTACTAEAKICPDGTSVGRTGPDCQFAPCPSLPVSTPVPTQTKNGYLIGQVTLGPRCPIEKTPPDPNCAPDPYPTFVDISGEHNFYIELHTDAQGFFRTPLPPATYTVLVHNNSLNPRCESKNVIVASGVTTTADISCDTGIR